jgi:hypothetical protein
MTQTITIREGRANVFVAVEHANSEVVRIHASRSANRFEALEPVPWGEPDVQGIWTDETDTRLQRSAKYTTQEFFTAAQRAELDAARAALLEIDRRLERRTESDVTGAYNSVFLSVKRVGARTSKIVDPPEGRIPSLTPEAQKIAAAEREFNLALLQSSGLRAGWNTRRMPSGMPSEIWLEFGVARSPVT